MLACCMQDLIHKLQESGLGAVSPINTENITCSCYEEDTVLTANTVHNFKKLLSVCGEHGLE